MLVYKRLCVIATEPDRSESQEYLLIGLFTNIYRIFYSIFEQIHLVFCPSKRFRLFIGGLFMTLHYREKSSHKSAPQPKIWQWKLHISRLIILSILSFFCLIGTANAIALNDAANAGDEAKIKALISNGSELNAQDHNLNTALHIAVEKRNAKIVKSLLDAKANPNLRNRLGYTPLALACITDQPDLVKLLIAARADLNVKLNNEAVGGFTPAMMMAFNNNTRILKLLIDGGANLSMVSDGGLATALSIAAQAGWIETVKMLIAAKVNINQAADIGGTALVRASESGKLDVVVFLMANGADPTVTNKAGWNAVMAAAWKGHGDILQYLIDKKVPLDAKYKDGSNALMWAVYEGHANTTSQLIAVRAKLNERAKSSNYKGFEFTNKTALTIARERKFNNLVLILKNAGATE